MPQLDFFIFQSILIYTTVAFIGLSFYLWNNILPKIYKSLKFRRYLKEYLDQDIDVSDYKINSSVNSMPLINLQKEIENRKTLINSSKNV